MSAAPTSSPTTWELSIDIPAVYDYVHNFRPTIHPGLQKEILELLFRQRYIECDSLRWDHSYLEKPKPSHNPDDVYVFETDGLIDVAYKRSELPEDTFIEGMGQYEPGKRLAVSFKRLGISASMMNTFLCVIENTNEIIENQDVLLLSLEADDDPCDERVYIWHKNPEFYLRKFENDLQRLETDLVVMHTHLLRSVRLVDMLNRIHYKKIASANKEAKILYAIEAVKRKLAELKA